MKEGTLGDVDHVAIESPRLSILGRFPVTRNDEDGYCARSRPPGLRNVLVTAP
jgi:hypothetical protein